MDLRFCTSEFHVDANVLVAGHGHCVTGLQAHAIGHSPLDNINVISMQSEMNGMGSLPVSAPSNCSG